MTADATSWKGRCEAVADMAAAQGPDILNDGKNVVSPFMAGERGDAVLKTVFEPSGNNKKFVEGLTGVPPLSMSGLRNNVPASAQPLGFSADVKPSMKESMPEMPASGKSRLPSLRARVRGQGLRYGLRARRTTRKVHPQRGRKKRPAQVLG
ncbi:hypothetical protein [uncultured Mailhella sp.]|uniref:hypothetical protein n=1 Tax=uncultured Mailhella sp. TaxID=1981031 RepID=UPI0025F98651|nr:hypothetical protein [uncultured Mailhella sp.]